MTCTTPCVKLVIFDLDGTVFISELCFNEIRNELGIDSEEPILEYISKLPSEKDRAIYHNKIRQIEQICAKNGSMASSAIKVFELLESKNIAMAIWTRNSYKATQIALGDHFVRFCHVETRECSEPKPNLAGLSRILKFSQVSIDEALFVGDSAYDKMAGELSGIKTLILKSNVLSYDVTSVTDVHLIDNLYQITHHL